ncbi:hypothetical protein B0F90DRAFT_1809498 [Multifurca ochricompacta]|uniref:Sodium/calcium exchanger membrane region domain-containing protein n=1 Tax=Multifurca ochricompacta TaxID=376703 RepID=A0AAD4QQ41_9AGAM|nr:hypothetical protein B0F90DRAFT_1809498 [Multifurca ochricompacta]
MIPLVKLHDLATRELAIRLGGSKAGLLNASLATALRKCELRVVQSSRKHKILDRTASHLAFCSDSPGSGHVLFAGGLRFTEQGFDATATQIHSSLLTISVGAVLMPAAYHFSLSWRVDATSTDQKSAILKMSHGVSVVLVAVYCAYLLFQLWSHTYLFEDSNIKSSRIAIKRPHWHHLRLGRFRGKGRSSKGKADSTLGSRSPPYAGLPSPRFKRSFPSASDVSLPIVSRPSSSLGSIHYRGTPTPAPALDSTVRLVRDGRCTVTTLPSGENLHSAASYAQLGDSTVVEQLVAVNAESLVESMDQLSGSISKEWVALILLPAMNCIAECLTAVNVSRKDRLTLASVFMVILGWILDKPLPLLFDPSIHIMSYIVADGKSNWLEGAILICFYINIAVSFWFYPGSTYSSTLGRCTADLRR